MPLTNTPNVSTCGRAPNNVHSSCRQDEPSPHRPSVDCSLVRVRVLRGPRVKGSGVVTPDRTSVRDMPKGGAVAPCSRMDRRECTISVPASTVVAAAARVEHTEGATPSEVEWFEPAKRCSPPKVGTRFLQARIGLCP